MEFKNNELFLKYKVDDDPFKFNWNLSELPEEEFQQSFTNPLMFCVEALSKENYKLKEIIEKKDQEIEQFKLEGAVLRRSEYLYAFYYSNIFVFILKYDIAPMRQSSAQNST